jgi:hypothetical protein
MKDKRNYKKIKLSKKLLVIFKLTLLSLVLVLIATNEFFNFLSESTNYYVLILTGIVIFWYAYETYLLRKEAQKNTINSVKPILIVDRYLFGGALEVINVGSGPALNIESRISYFHGTGEYTRLQEILKETESNYYHIAKNTKKNISINREIFEDYYSGIYNENGVGIGNSFALILTYNDMFGNKYQTVVRVEVNRKVENLPENCLFKQTLFDSYDRGELVRFPKNVIIQ